jgi:hypothetical protein
MDHSILQKWANDAFYDKVKIYPPSSEHKWLQHVNPGMLAVRTFLRGQHLFVCYGGLFYLVFYGHVSTRLEDMLETFMGYFGILARRPFIYFPRVR